MLSGAVGLQILARRLGVEISKRQFSHIDKIDENEVSFEDMKGVAVNVNLVCKVIKTNIAGLENACKKQPVLSLLNNGRYVIVLRINSDENGSKVVSVLDPSKSNPRPEKITLERFLSGWSKQGLIFGKSKRLLKESNEISLSSLVGDIFDNKWVLLQLVFIVIFISGFALAPTVFLIIVLDKVVNYEAYSTLYVVSSGVVLAHFFNLILSYLKQNIISLTAAKLEAKFGLDLFDQLINLPIATFGKQTQQFKGLTQSLAGMRSMVVSQLLGSLTDIVSVLVFAPILFFFSPLLGTIVFGFCLFGAITSIVHTRRIKHSTNEFSQAGKDRQRLINTTADGFSDIKRLGLEKELTREWRELEGYFLKSNEKTNASKAFILEFGNFLNNVLTVVVLFVGVHMVFSGSLSAGVLVGVNMMIGKVYRPTLSLVKLPLELKKLSDLLANLNKSTALSTETISGGQYHSVLGNIVFQDVSLSFDNENYALKDIKFSIDAGETVGVCGNSGSGKSLIGQLMQGLHSPNSGKIFVDGNDLKTFNLQHLRSQISLVDENFYFFPGSIRDNMHKVLPNANNERILWACALAGIDKEISKLEQGYETNVNDNNPILTRSFKIRLALARAIIRNPKVLIIDDIFDSLDTENELVFLENFPNLCRGRTVIIIAQQIHRLRQCKKIMCVEVGKISQFDLAKNAISKSGPIQEILTKQISVISPKLSIEAHHLLGEF